jgi:O-antigen/teichoic acid export membrane protein
LAGFAVLAVGLVNSVRFLQTRRRRFDIVGRALAFQGLVRGLLPLLLAPANLGWIGLTLGDTLGRIVGIRPMLANVSAQLRTRLQTFTFRDVGRVLKRHKNYLQILLPSSLVNAVATALPLPLIARLFGLEAAGEFALISRIAAAPAALIGNSVADVFHGHLVQWLRAPGSTAIAEMNRTALKLLIVSLLIYVPSAILAPTVFPIVFGPQWQQLGSIFAALAPFLCLGLVVSPLSRVLIVTERMHFKLWFDGLFLVVPCSALWLAREKSYLWAITWFSAAATSVYAVYWLLIRRAVITAARNRLPQAGLHDESSH